MFTNFEKEMETVTVKQHLGLAKSIWNNTTGEVRVYDKAGFGKVFNRNEYSAAQINEYIWELENRAKNNLNANVSFR